MASLGTTRVDISFSSASNELFRFVLSNVCGALSKSFVTSIELFRFILSSLFGVLSKFSVGLVLCEVDCLEDLRESPGTLSCDTAESVAPESCDFSDAYDWFSDLADL